MAFVANLETAEVIQDPFLKVLLKTKVEEKVVRLTPYPFFLSI